MTEEGQDWVECVIKNKIKFNEYLLSGMANTNYNKKLVGDAAIFD